MTDGDPPEVSIARLQERVSALLERVMRLEADGEAKQRYIVATLVSTLLMLLGWGFSIVSTKFGLK